MSSEDVRKGNNDGTEGNDSRSRITEAEIALRIADRLLQGNVVDWSRKPVDVALEPSFVGILDDVLIPALRERGSAADRSVAVALIGEKWAVLSGQVGAARVVDRHSSMVSADRVVIAAPISESAVVFLNEIQRAAARLLGTVVVDLGALIEATFDQLLSDAAQPPVGVER